MSERANQQTLSTPAPGHAINTTTAIEDVVPGQLKEICLAGIHRLLIARIYRHGWRKPGRNTHYTVAALTRKHCVLFSGQKCGTAGGGRNWPGGRFYSGRNHKVRLYKYLILYILLKTCYVHIFQQNAHIFVFFNVSNT